MNIIVISLLVILCSIILYFILYVIFFNAKDKKRGLDLIFLQVLIPKKDGKEDKDSDGEQFGSSKEYTKMIGVMTQLFSSLHTIRGGGFIDTFFYDDFFTCEYSTENGQIKFHIGVPIDYRELFDKQISSYYPDAVIEQTDAPNIFTEGNEVACKALNLSTNYYLPIKTVSRLESDSLNNIISALSKIHVGEGAAIQIIARPVENNWQSHCNEKAKEIYSGKKKGGSILLKPFSLVKELISMLIKGPESDSGPKGPDNEQTTPMVQERVKAIEEKSNKVGFDIIVRLVGSSKTKRKAKMIVSDLSASFEQFSSPDMNGFSTANISEKKIIKDYIYRMFSRGKYDSVLRYFKIKEWRQVISAEELSTIYHFPNAQYNKSGSVQWQEFKIAPAPHNLPKEGLLLGINNYKGESREVRIKRDDRRRHFYAIGKSGTGKSNILENMIKQDVQNGEGVCVIDPHGDLVEAILPYIPRERADDVILFDPGDLGRPMGLNLLEAETEEQKEFVSQEALAIFIKLYGEEIMGPRLQHYFRNGVLTLLADDEEGATLLDIMRIFTDPEYEAVKKPKVTNPSVRAFWDREMAKTGQREKEEIIPYFAAKFGPFTTNAQIRNILGQEKSGFKVREVMDGQKILLVNLSKGKLGDLNAKLLGMIMVSKIQMAAMSRVDTAEHLRKDFYLYVDEFQNFVTDSFASILSEARKYRLNLVVAHQYISQITKMDGGGKGSHEDTTIRDAVFGNVGSMMCFKIGAQDAETMEKEFAPVFSQQDLINIANYQAYIKLNINNATSKGFSMQTIYDKSSSDEEAAEAYRQLSRLKFARDKSFVDREIKKRLSM